MSEIGRDAAGAPTLPRGAVQGIGLLLASFSDAVDGKQADEVARLFAPDGVFQPADEPIRGREVIRRFYTERLRDPLRRTRHVWANVHISISGRSEVAVRAVLTNYAYDPTISQTELQQRIGNVTARCIRDEDGIWRFREHLYRRIFALRLPLADVPTTIAAT